MVLATTVAVWASACDGSAWGHGAPKSSAASGESELVSDASSCGVDLLVGVHGLLGAA